LDLWGNTWLEQHVGFRCNEVDSSIHPWWILSGSNRWIIHQRIISSPLLCCLCPRVWQR
jgi:hypothetical protein